MGRDGNQSGLHLFFFGNDPSRGFQVCPVYRHPRRSSAPRFSQNNKSAYGDIALGQKVFILQRTVPNIFK